MSQIINNLKVFDDFDPKLRQLINCCFAGKLSTYCVLNDNKVYGLGEYINILGYSDSNKKYVLIKELCNQNIEEFYEGDEGFTMFARSKTNEIFCWGFNNGRIRRPHKIDFFDDKHIVNICCVRGNCLALSSNGLIYECKNMERCVDSVYSQRNHMERDVDSGWNEDIASKFISRNELFNVLYYVKNISINSLHRFNFIWVETFNCSVYKFKNNQGDRRWYVGIYDFMEEYSERIDFKTNLSINSETFYGAVNDLSRCLERRVCNLKEVKKSIQNKFNGKNNEIIDFCFDDDFQIICETKRCVYIYSIRNSEVKRTNYKTIFEYFLLSTEATYKTIHFEDNKYYVYNIEISTNDNSKQLVNIRKEHDLTEYCCGQNETNSFLRKFFYSKDLLQISDSIIKYYYQMKDNSLYVVNDKAGNKVYCLGRNTFGILGLGHGKRVYEPTEIIELRNENIEDFYAGFDFMFARNDRNEIISWGDNYYGQLARGFKSKSSLDYLKPVKIDFKGEQIIDISIGQCHGLALSSECCVYVWGKNYWRQNVSVKNDYILTPEEIILEKSIKFIHCSEELSFVVTTEGECYYWGEIDGGHIFNKKFIPVPNVHKLYNYRYGQVIILDNNGNPSIFDLKNEINNKIDHKCKDKIIDLYYDYRIDCLLQSEEWVYRLIKNFEHNGFNLIKTNYKCIGDFSLNKVGYYNKAIEISEKGRLMTKEILFEENTFKFKKHLIFDTKYETYFEEIDEIGRGCYGIVYKVKKKSNKIHYAIKIMEIEETDVMEKGLNELVLKEIKTMKKLSTDFVVEYIDSWIQEKRNWYTNKVLIFIQMELCPLNLKDFIGFMKGMNENKFQIINYFISCELLGELIECVNHLHSLPKPLGPIIHRDLKPENILISDGINGKFLKLCDFGIAKTYERSFHSVKGTPKYIAPEVYSRRYNKKADIYSLALIAAEIFQLIDINYDDQLNEIRGYKDRKSFDIYLPKYSGTILENKFVKLLDMISKCLTPKDYHLRLDCTQLKYKIEEFSIDKNIALNDGNISDFKLFLEKQNIIFKKFFEIKTKENPSIMEREIRFWEVNVKLPNYIKNISSFLEVDFPKENKREANKREANKMEAKFRKVKLSGGKIFEKQIFKRQYFRESNFRPVKFLDAKFREAKLISGKNIGRQNFLKENSLYVH